ncbi:YxeA family protein [uncultured Vagococcus sp.]|uniref:YxeA family protein n=1 Tax=uncultured Vagococcus sp. TaxID=189676 RepID=UPI0028D85DE5|nr:YxeA family protein [uncultured Vagococcus sp.]
MKKLLAIVCIFIIGAGLGLYHYYYGGSAYYTKINSSGKEITQIVDQTKEEMKDYEYSQPAFNDKGDERHLTFNGSIGRPLKLNSYLKLKVNRLKGVVSWEEMKKSDVPKKALSHLNN